MTELNKQALREAAEKADSIGWDGIEYELDVGPRATDFISCCSPTTVLALLDELEAAEKRIAELTGKPAEEYADDDELLFEIDFCDDLSTSIQVAQWLKELRIRRAAGIGVNGELQGGKCE